MSYLYNIYIMTLLNVPLQAMYFYGYTLNLNEDMKVTLKWMILVFYMNM